MVVKVKLFNKNMKIKKLKKLIAKNTFLTKERAIILAVMFFAASIRLFFEFIPSNADANWYDADWKYRQVIATNPQQITDEHSSYPLLINTTQVALKSIWSGGRMGKVNAGDIVFTDADGTTKIPHEIEKYTFSTGELIAWVKIPTLLATSQNIYMYYGNENCADQWDTVGAVWSDRYSAVYHLGDNCSMAGCYKDSVHGNNATPYSGDTVSNVNDNLGKIGQAVTLDGDNDYLRIPDSSYLDLSDTVSIESYVQLNELNRYNSVFDKGAYNLKVSPDKKYIFGGRTDSTGAYFSQTAYFDSSSSVLTSMAEFGGELYVSVENASPTASKIYKSVDGVTFSVANTFNVDDKIGGLTVFKDSLYVFVNNVLYSSSNGTNWSVAYTASENISSLVVFQNYLYLGTEVSGLVYRSLIGWSWSLAEDFLDSEIMDVKAMTVYDGKLFLGGDQGSVFMTSNGTDYSLDEDFGDSVIVSALSVFDGKLWVGISDGDTGNTYYRNFNGTYSVSNFPAI